MTQRRHDIDWLRVIAILAIFVYHCTRFFDTEGWELKNPQQSELVFILTRSLIWPWVMELFFLLSGVGTWYALESRNAGAYLWERVKRLLIPLYTVGFFVLLPIQYYFTRYTNSGYTGTFWQIIPRYFSDLRPPRATAYPGSLLPMVFSGHLWFLKYLFLISLILLPLLLYLRSARGQRVVGKLGEWSDGRGGIFLFLVPLVLARVGLQGMFAGPRSWADLVWYAIFFLAGYMMGADRRFSADIRKFGWISLIPWFVGLTGVILSALALGYDPYSGRGYSWGYLLYQVSGSVMGWGAVLFVLSLGAKYLNTNRRALAYGNEAVLPFYLLHQTVILCAGWFVVPWELGILPKLLIITGLSSVVIMMLYEGLVRHINVVRFLFGMRPKKRRIPT